MFAVMGVQMFKVGDKIIIKSIGIFYIIIAINDTFGFFIEITLLETELSLHSYWY